MNNIPNVLNGTQQTTGNLSLVTDPTGPTPSVDAAVTPQIRPRVVIPSNNKYYVIDPTTYPEADPSTFGYYVSDSDDRLTTYTMRLLLEEQKVNGQVETSYRFIVYNGAEERLLVISASEFNNDQKLVTAVENVCGAKARTYCKPKQLREAVREHMDAVSYRRQRVTSDFGWDGRHVYRFPGGSVDRDGYRAPGDDDVRIQLPPAGFASRLNLAPPPDDLAAMLKHVWEDLIGVNDRRVTLSLLGAAGAAVLYPFVEGFNHFALWLLGKSGSGKSFAMQLFLNFFGDFPPCKGFVSTWNSTAGALQEEGFHAKDALYAVDDYKLEVVDSVEGAVTLIQNYADLTGRGRLKGGGGVAKVLPIRGMLVSTGELVPEHSASSLARMIVVRVPEGATDLERGKRCLERRKGYPGIMSAFIHHLLATGLTGQFAGRVDYWQDAFNDGTGATANAIRVAGNLAIMAASLEAWADFLTGAAPEAEDAITKFIEDDMPVFRTGMLGRISGSGGRPTYLALLNELVREERTDNKGLLYIGDKVVGKRMSPEVLFVSFGWSKPEINEALTSRGWPEIHCTQLELVKELQGEGVLCDLKGRVVPEGATADVEVQQVERHPTRGFLIRSEKLGLA